MSSMAASSGFGFKGGLGSSFSGGEDYPVLAKSVPCVVSVGKAVRAQPVMKNVNEGKGLFAPLAVVTRLIVGMKRFNQLRGKPSPCILRGRWLGTDSSSKEEWKKAWIPCMILCKLLCRKHPSV
ncbi:protein PROTON GRADIENT REGULATION 5, chloroplastic-like isoform X2 [Hibiscus syriacus]|uniref:protein PROTON GRADIENT REGULATION 5, chloroplastic-like isoform X2 n=1 Tax=Hibiscus syriacus TaxID=106335 RepID=UPI001920759C|nr:protein PROTON GRADIENT REGULATION 5, chloroplastic-like isoform X2 [Hibiscus syriacus]